MLWNNWPGTVKLSWIILACSIVALVFTKVLHFKKNEKNEIAIKKATAILITRMAALIAYMLCMWGIGTTTMNSGNSIDTPRLDVVENMAVACIQSFMLLQFFVTVTAIVMVLTCVIEYMDRRCRQKEIGPIE